MDDVAVDMVVVVDRACVVMTKMLVNVSGGPRDVLFDMSVNDATVHQ